MSRSPYFFVERYDKNIERYEIQHPLVWNSNHTKRVPADLFPYNGNHDLFSIVEESAYEINVHEMRGIHRGLPENVSIEIKEAYDKLCYETEYAGEKHLYTPTARWFTYADMYIYCLEYPEVIDYDAMDEAYYNNTEENPPKKIMKPTPVKILMNRINAFMEVIDDWNWRNDYSQIRIVYWIE